MSAYRIITTRLNLLERITSATYPQLLLLWLITNALFTAAYYSLVIMHPEHAPTIPEGTHPEQLFNVVYYSIITATSTGYGDIVPQGFSKVLAMFQTILALIIFAVFVTKLVSRKQEIALSEVHRMAFEGIFANIRQGLFTVRKDFDLLMHNARTNAALTERDWERLATGYLQCQSLLEEVPDLYTGKAHDLYSMDLKRERLIFKSIHRTLDRIDMTLRVFNDCDIDWVNHAESTKELHSLMKVMDAIMPLWRERSPYHEVEEFEDIYNLSNTLHADITRALEKKG